MIVSVLRWNSNHQLLPVWVGGILGTEFLPVAENIVVHDLKLTKLVFRTIIFQIVLLLLSFYVISSSGSVFGASLVMVMNLQLLKDQILELKTSGTLSDSWFLYLKREAFSYQFIRNYLGVLSILFVLLSFFFLRL